jgi:lysozyme family protein
MAIIKSKPFDPEYTKNYNEAKVDAHRVWEVNALCKQILANRQQYVAAQLKTSVPWEVIACIHYRESSLNFKAVLHNGERIVGTQNKTKLVPKGCGPFATWEASAIDALLMKKYLFPKVWTIETELKFIEAFNGLGYKRKRELSPYVWAATTKHDETGKYVADGRYDAKAIEKQLGAVAILKTLRT